MEDKAKDKRQGKEERILHVIEIAKRLFIEHGYSATSTAQIARESEIAELTLFRYFPTKRKLFEAVIRRLVNFEGFAQSRVNEEPSQRSDLFNLIHERVRFVKQERELVRIVIVESQFQPDLAGEFNPVVNASSQIRRLLLGKGLNQETCQIIMHLIMGLLLSIVFTPHYVERTIDTTVRLIESQILHLLKGNSMHERINKTQEEEKLK